MKRILFIYCLFFHAITAFSQSCNYTKDHNGNFNLSNISCNYDFLNNSCIRIDSNFPTLFDTNSYNATQSPNYIPTGNYNEGTPIFANDDDKFIKRIQLNSFGENPFIFSFYGRIRNSFIISTNGFISFDENLQEGDYSTPDTNSNAIPDRFLPQLSIFGAYHDMIFAEDQESEIYYQISGEYPCRKLTINFYKGIISGTSQTSTFQIVLHESTSDIDVNILEKPISGAGSRFKNAIIGVTNDIGGGIAAPDRNTGIWSANQTTYQFTPNGNSLTPRAIRWTNDINTTTQNTNSITICNVNPSNYTARATYVNTNGETFYVSDTHKIVLSQDYPIAKNHREVICNSTTSLAQTAFYDVVNIQTNHSLFRYKFYLTEIDANNNATNYLPSEQILSPGQTYYVRIENNADSTCFAVAKLELASIITFPTFIEICDAGNDRQEEYTLANINCQLFQNISNISNIKYFIDNQTTPVTTAVLTENSTIKVQYNLPGCGTLISPEISVKFKDGPMFLMEELIFESYEELFDIVTDNNPANSEPFIWSEELEEREIIITNEEEAQNIKVFNSYADAVNNRNSVNRLKEGEENLDYKYELFLRIENTNTDCKGNCFNILPIKARVKFKKIILNIDDNDTDNPIDDPLKYDAEDANVYLCADQSYTLNLLTDVHRIFRVTNRDINSLNITYHNSYSSANNLEDQGIDPIVETINYNTLNFYVRLQIPNEDPEIKEYVVKLLQYRFLPYTLTKNTIDICVDYTVLEKEITLRNYISSLFQTSITSLNPAPIIEFYADEEGTIPVDSLTATRAYKRVWVKVKFDQTEVLCETINPLDIRLIANEGIIKSSYEYKIDCDNNSDQKEILDLTSFNTEYVAQPENYVIKYFKNYNPNNHTFSNPISNATQFPITANTTIYISIAEIGQITKCEQMLELKINLAFDEHPQIILEEEAYLLKCNEANREYVSYNLASALSQLYLESNNPEFSSFITNVKYYESLADASSGNENTITSINNYQLLSSIPAKIIYVRFESSYGCYSIAPIHLKILGIIKLKNNLRIELCDNNFDGIYDFNLRAWINNLTTDEDTSNDLLTDPIANRLATYKIALSEADYNNGIFLTSEQEENFIYNPAIHTSIIISASLEGGCEDRVNVQLVYLDSTTHTFNMSPICDELNDGVENIDLTIFETNFPNATFIYFRTLSDLNSNTNPIETPSNYAFELALGNKIYFKVIDIAATCPSLGIITIPMNESPIIEIEDYTICPTDSIIIEPNYLSWDIIAYEWRNPNGEIIGNNPSIELNEVGVYQLKITAANGCTYTEEFSIAHYDLPIFDRIIYQQNTAIIRVNGSRLIEYSMDGINWQTSPNFTNLQPGVHSFYFRYANEYCISGPVFGLIPIIHNTITPNGDGINDIWSIKDLDVFNGQNAKLEIFDRYGKSLYKQESNTELFWNGKVDGKPVPSTSYWYTIALPDGRTYTSYINVMNK